MWYTRPNEVSFSEVQTFENDSLSIHSGTTPKKVSALKTGYSKMQVKLKAFLI